MAPASSTKGRTAGFFHRVLLARKRGITGSGPISRSGSIRPLTWFATSTSGLPGGMRSAPATSTSRKKTLRMRRTKARRKRSAALTSPALLSGPFPPPQSPHHPGPLLPSPPSLPLREKRENNSYKDRPFSPSPGEGGREGTGEGARG